MKKKIAVLVMLLVFVDGICESGYDLWLRYRKIENDALRKQYETFASKFFIAGSSPTNSIIGRELKQGLSGLLAKPVSAVGFEQADVIVALANDKLFQSIQKIIAEKTDGLSTEGFAIFSTALHKKRIIVITATEEPGLLYGSFHFLKLLQTHQSIEYLDVKSDPKIKIRILNHWDNLDRTVERGYAGFSLWDWHKLPDYIDPRYHDYARANASIGINATVLTNVNANALVLTPLYLEKVKALADVFRPYHIKVYLTARFSAPIEIGGLKTADPLNPEVQDWWNKKVQEIYKYIPDFGGFVVKANSEGQPGPQNYQRTHADGANMLADALKPFEGVVMWRAFVYDNAVPVDRTMQAYNEFKPLDGKFHDNVIIQVKNGPLDFQPREPFHPLFGAMTNTSVMVEFQITQEYLGFSTHLVYLATLFQENLQSDTYAYGHGSTVSKIVDGSLTKQARTAMAGVANIGTDRNWCGHQFAQANWYAFGRLAWDHAVSSSQIAEDWIRMTFTNERDAVATIKDIMMTSREALVNYMTPLGLHHIMGWNHHYGPGPWITDKHRADWTSVYYHRADSLGVGFDRTATGSNGLGQYHPMVAQQYSTLTSCPSAYLLWFHRVRWDHVMPSGRTLWHELCFRYDDGVRLAGQMEQSWQKLKSSVDEERFTEVAAFLKIQQKEAKWWRDACTTYFQSVSKKPFPNGFTAPAHSLEYYLNQSFPYAPGIKPQW